MKAIFYTAFFMLLSATMPVTAQVDGSLDLTFDPGVGPNAAVGNMTVQPDGKVLICLGFNKYNNVSRSEIARINTDGTLDNTFDPGSGGAFGNIRSMAVQPDGRIIIGGSYTNYNNQYTERLSRIHADGTFDTTFRTTLSGVNGEVIVVALQSDGKVLVGGAFSGYKGKTSKNLVRVLPNGDYDSTFVVGTGPNNGSTISAIQILADGKILIAGAFGEYNGKVAKRLARINTDGSLDTTFKPVAFGSDLANALVLPGGKIMISGYFGSVNGVPAPRIARLNSDGSHDTSFKAIMAPYPFAVGSMCLLPDGKLLVCADNAFRRLNTDGSIDSTFNGGVSPASGVSVCKLLPDGRPMIAGSFTTYNGVTRNRVARLKGPLGASVEQDPTPASGIRVYPNPTTGMLYFEEEVNDIVITDIQGKTVLTLPGAQHHIDLDLLTEGVYILRASHNGWPVHTKVSRAK